MVMITVQFIDEIPNEVRDYLITNLKHLDNVNLQFLKNKSELINEIIKADILIGWRPDIDLLKKAVKLKLFINPGAGVRHLIEMFKEINKDRAVLLANGHGNSYFVAQHAVGLLLTLMNKVIPHHKWMESGIWRTGDKEAASIPLRFLKVGLFGYGAINQKVHKMLSGFDIEFAILRKNWNKQKKPLISPAQRFDFSQIEDFLKLIQILIIAVPSTSLTDGILKRKELELLGKQGIVVNVARGEIIDQEGLYFALKERSIAGAAIDVWYDKNPKADEKGKKYPFIFPFHKLDNIILSPHRGYSPFKDLLRWNEIVENVTRMSQERNDFINLVNLDDEY
jgi:phosphoglycerate dehydrogenase-like enzyme